MSVCPHCGQALPFRPLMLQNLIDGPKSNVFFMAEYGLLPMTLHLRIKKMVKEGLIRSELVQKQGTTIGNPNYFLHYITEEGRAFLGGH